MSFTRFLAYDMDDNIGKLLRYFFLLLHTFAMVIFFIFLALCIIKAVRTYVLQYALVL